MAPLFANGRLVTLETDNHILQDGEAAWDVLLSELRAFLGYDARPGAEGLSELSERELDVLALVAEGLDNDEIGARLFISERRRRACRARAARAGGPAQR